MAERLDAAAEETLLTLLQQRESEPEQRRRRLRLVAYEEDGGAVLEFVVASGGENLEDRVALLGEQAEESPSEQEVSLRLLRHLATSVRHQQYHDTDIVTPARGCPRLKSGQANRNGVRLSMSRKASRGFSLIVSPISEVYRVSDGASWVTITLPNAEPQSKETVPMASTQDSSQPAHRRASGSCRDPDFDAQLADSGVSSVDAVTFFKEVNDTFDLGLEAEDCLKFKT